MSSLSGQFALVTGASRGIGAAIAIELAKQGASVFIIWTPSERSEKSAREVLKAMAKSSTAPYPYTSFKGMPIDLRESNAPAKITQKCFEETDFTHIHILVNNAGMDHFAPLADLTAADFDSSFHLNVRVPLFMAQAVAPHLRKPSRVFNISFVAARCGFPDNMLYSASKGALEALTRSLAASLGPDGHTVNTVEPGPTETDMVARVPKEIVEAQKKTTPVEHRLGTAQDVALVVVWLAGEESRWVSGKSISASGG